MAGKTVKEKNAEAYARYSKRGVSLSKELEDILRVLGFQREAIEKAMFTGIQDQGYVDPKIVSATKELTLSYSSAVASKIKLDKHMKALADEMTYEEQKDAVVEFIKVMDAKERRDILKMLTDYHNDMRLGFSGASMDPEKVQ